jgi:glycosyltransferase involved in cell wall biosynthesis
MIDRFSMRKRFDHVFVQTETEKNYLLNILPSTNISRFTLFGFDFNIFKPLDKSTVRNKLGIPLERKIMLSVGRANAIKGVHNVVKVFQELKNEIPELDLYCVDVQQGDQYYDLIKESGAKYTGPVFYNDLPDYYSAADVLVYLPFDDESLNFAGPGYVNMEALACGIPVVSSLLVNFWDEKINEVSRIPTTIEDALIMTRDLLQNPPDPLRCREVCFKYYNWSYIMDHHLSVYSNLFRKYYNTSIY